MHAPSFLDAVGVVCARSSRCGAVTWSGTKYDPRHGCAKSLLNFLLPRAWKRAVLVETSLRLVFAHLREQHHTRTRVADLDFPAVLLI